MVLQNCTASEEEDDALDRLIKTYDPNMVKFNQRIDKLKRLNSCGGSSQLSKSTFSNQTSSRFTKQRRPLSSLSSRQHAQPAKALGLPVAAAHVRLKSSNILHAHSYSQLQIVPVSSRNERDCGAKLFKPLLQIGGDFRRTQSNSGLATSKAEAPHRLCND